MNNFINTQAVELSLARVQSLLAPMTPQPFPVLTVGTKRTFNFFFHNNGTLESWSGVATHSLRVTLANAISAPAGSNFTITIGADDIECAYDIDADTLSTALNANATIAAEGGVDVYQQGTGRFLIAYRDPGAPTAMTVDASLLYPDCVAELTTLTEGVSSTVRELLMLTLRKTSAVQSTSWNVIASPYAGWTGVLDLTGAAAQELLRTNGELVGDMLQCTSLLTVEVIDASGNSTCYYQTPVLLRALNYMIAQNLPFGPSRNAQASSAAGTVTVTPASQVHTERITFTGTGTRNVVVAVTGLVAGAHVDLVCIVSGATDGMVINVYQVSTSGTKWIQFTKASGDTNALFALRADGNSGFNNVEQIVPAYTDA